MVYASVIRERHDLRALRLSRPVDEVLVAGEPLAGLVHSVFHRVANLRVESGYLLAVSAPEVAEGASDSLLPLLWVLHGIDTVWPTDLVNSAAGPAALLYRAAARYDPGGVRVASSGLAGLGPGLTPSGTDWLVGAVLGTEAALAAEARRRAAPCEATG